MNYEKIIAFVYEAKNFVFSKTRVLDVKSKNPYDFVTAVDTSISDFLKQNLYKEFPDVGFVTEEENEHIYNDKFFIVDPIDGTTNLIYDYKMSSISLAYVENGQVEFGVVFNPFANEMFLAVKGNGAYLYDTRGGIEQLLNTGVVNYKTNPLKVSERSINNAIIEFGASSSRKNMAGETFARAQRVFENCLDLRRICSTAIAICYVAAARIDGYFEKYIKPWDYAAGILILEEAGGISSDWNRDKLTLDKESSIICSNQNIYERLAELM